LVLFSAVPAPETVRVSQREPFQASASDVELGRDPPKGVDSPTTQHGPAPRQAIALSVPPMPCGSVIAGVA
jgi:hypothetical protein